MSNGSEITEKLKKIRKSGDLFQTLVDNAVEGILMAEVKTRKFIYGNAAICRMFGYTWDEFSHLSVRNIHPEKDLPMVIATFEAQARGEIKLASDLPCLRKNGTVFYADIKTSATRIDGQLCNVGFFTDTTQRRESEKIKRDYLHFLESMERFDAAIRFEMDQDRILRKVIQTVFSIFECDRAWLLFPCDPDATHFRVPVEVVHPDFPGASALDVEIPLSAGHRKDMLEALKSDIPVISSDDSVLPVTLETREQFGVNAQMFMAIYPRVGKPWLFGLHQCAHVHAWSSEEQDLFREIGRRIADWLSIVLFVRDLRESELRYRATFEQTAVGIAHVTTDGRWIRVNQKLCAIFGYSRKELLQRSIDEVMTGADGKSDRETILAILQGEQSTFTSEKCLQRSDGVPVWIHQTVLMVRPSGDEPPYLIYILEDISSRKEAAEEKKKLHAQLLYSQKMESIAGLAAGMAHEINNPLAGILQSVQTLENRLFQSIPANLKAADEIGIDLKLISEYMKRRKIDVLSEIIKTAGLKASGIVKNMLNFSRTDSGEKTRCSLTYLLDETVKLCRNDYNMKKKYNFERIDLVREYSAEIPPVLCMPGKIQQVFLNILKNAVEAVNEKDFSGEVPRIVMRIYPVEARVCVEIEDNGPGMDEAIRIRICEPFFTTKEVGVGTGLGLYVSYLIVSETHNGELTAESRKGSWTRFRICLPVNDPPASPKSSHREF